MLTRMRTFADDVGGGSAAAAAPPENAIERAVAEARAEEAERTPPVNKGGRPKGVRDSRPRKKPGQAGASTAPPPPAEPPSQATLACVAFAWAVVWKLIAAKTDGSVRLLTEDETKELAEATVPVLDKYSSSWDEWAPEIGLGMAVIGMVSLTMITPPPPPADDQPNAHGSTATVID